MHEFLSDDELREQVKEEVATVQKKHAALGQHGDRNKLHLHLYRTFRDRIMLSNLRYLAAIGRLPDSFDIDAIEAETGIPDGIE